MSGKYIRPANGFENFLEMFHHQGTMLSCYWMCLGSKCDLQPEHVLQTLKHLFRKIPTLRTCFKRKEKKLWVCEMNEEKIDFKVDNNTSHEELFEKLSTYHYNSDEGPVWCARMNQKDLKIEGVDYDEDFQKQTHIFFGFHHAITDGFSNVKICNYFMEYLNRVISANAIDDLEQLCTYDDGRISEQIIGEIDRELQADKIKSDELQEKFVKFSTHECLLPTLNKCIATEKQRTVNIQKTLSKDKTTLLLKKCKEHGVSINSCFTAAANLGYEKLLKDLGADQETNLVVNHVINHRRYWHMDSSKMFGPHIGQLLQHYHMPSIISDFWEYALKLHKEFYDSMKNKDSYKYLYMRMKDMKQIPNQEAIAKPAYDYGITNMGNLKGLLNEDGENVRVYRLIRTTSTHGLGNICSHSLQTFRGHLFYGIDYVPKNMSPNAAEMYITNIFNKIDEIIQ